MQNSRDYFIRQTLNNAIVDLRKLAHDLESDMDYFIRVRQYADRMYVAINDGDMNRAKEWAKKYKQARFTEESSDAKTAKEL